MCTKLRARELDADAACISEAFEVSLSLLPTVVGADGEPTQQVITVYAEQAPSQAEPTVYVGLNDATGWPLTAQEGVTFARTVAQVSSGVLQ